MAIGCPRRPASRPVSTDAGSAYGHAAASLAAHNGRARASLPRGGVRQQRLAARSASGRTDQPKPSSCTPGWPRSKKRERPWHEGGRRPRLSPSGVHGGGRPGLAYFRSTWKVSLLPRDDFTPAEARTLPAAGRRHQVPAGLVGDAVGRFARRRRRRDRRGTGRLLGTTATGPHRRHGDRNAGDPLRAGRAQWHESCRRQDHVGARPQHARARRADNRQKIARLKAFLDTPDTGATSAGRTRTRSASRRRPPHSHESG